MISCPSCGRDNVGVEKLAVVVEERLKAYPQAFEVAVMGCAVSGPGTASAGTPTSNRRRPRRQLRAHAHGRVLKKVGSEDIC